MKDIAINGWAYWVEKQIKTYLKIFNNKIQKKATTHFVYFIMQQQVVAGHRSKKRKGVGSQSTLIQSDHFISIRR